MTRAKTLEELFIKEFKSNVRVIGTKNVYDVPIPDACKDWLDTVGFEEFAIKGIKKEKFTGLNRTIVRKIPKGYEVKQRKIDKATRGHAKDANGKFIYEDYKIPSGSMAIISDVNLKLDYKYYKSAEDGYGYVDFIKKKDGSIKYIYVVPKEVLYNVHRTALVLSMKSSMICYSGKGYTTWNKGAIYLYVVPYSARKRYDASVVLKTKVGSKAQDFTEEIQMLEKYWESVNFIPSIELSNLTTGENLCLKHITINQERVYSPVDMLPISKKEIYGDDEYKE